MTFPTRPLLLLSACALVGPVLRAQTAPPGASVQKLSPLVVQEAPSVAEKFLLPQVTESVTATRIEDTINLLDPEDAVKYLPSVFLRKRNNGDTQAIMATRTWGVSSSARSLVYADGVLLTALIANNNSLGGPRWGLVAPAEIERVDLMYGPYAAAYAGNSMGAVMEITTRLPEKFEATLQHTAAFQTFSQYGTDDTYRTSQTAATVGHRAGKFSVWVSANYQDSHSQPLGYVTNATFPTGTTGGFAASNKLGAPAQVVGASGLLHTRMTNAKFKAAYDLTPALRAAYTIGLWRNDADSAVSTYLTNAAGQPTYGGLAAFASGTNDTLQEHSSHSLSLRSDTRGAFDFEAIATLYRMDRDRVSTPTTASATAAPSPSFGAAGRFAILGGTGWSTLDLKGTWRPGGKNSSTHIVTFGAHQNRNKLYNPTFNTADWRNPDAPSTGVATEGDGKTRTQALWAQEVWTFARGLKLTVGARYEAFRASDGLNVNGATTVRQPTVTDHGFSPKAVLAYTLSSDWLVTASVGQAYRFATAAELYQLVSTGTTFTSPNPNLKPDDVLATELKIQRNLPAGRIRLSLFQDDIHDAIIAQFNPLLPGSTQLFSFLSNVNHVRSRGAELVLEQNNVLVRGLEFTGSLTYLDAKTLALSGRASATAPASAAIGKKLPNIPDWRAAFVLTYRPDQRWAFSVAGRYSDKLWTTLDNTDVNPNTYQGFAAWFVADVHANLRFSPRWNAGLGVDNFLNRKYFIFHPFPQRTTVLNLKYNF
ncbi:MAG: TonB-dependent receptor [Verrucomicrobia bacterium]|nr:TonB-dependent receptor [Verrucomicrobiota bacterium]